MKYWLLTTEYPPFYGGGISTYCYHTAQMLLQLGHSVTVFVPDDRVENYRITFSGQVRIIRFNKSRNNTQSFLGYVPALSYAFAAITRDVIRLEGKPDCIESQEYLAIAYYLIQFRLLLYPEFAGVAVVLTLHAPAFLYMHYNQDAVHQFPDYWTGELEISCIRSADHIIAPSRYIVDEIKKFTAIDETKLSVIRNPYLSTGTPPNKAVQRNKIVFFGKLTPQKGVFELFAYMRALWDGGSTLCLTVIGGTDKVYHPEMKTIGQVIEQQYAPYIKRGLVRFLGNVPPASLHGHLADAHVILIPSTVDNLPYAAIEAMGMGKVVLASRQGGQAEIIRDGVDGFLFDHKSPQTFADKLAYILSLDDEALAVIGNAAVLKVRQLLDYKTVGTLKMAAISAMLKQPGGTIFPFTREIGPAAKPVNSSNGNTLLTVVVPCFNMGAYIKACVDSVLASAYAPVEIIIVNDGSTEQETVDALQQIAGNPAVRVIHKTNEGLAATRNYGAAQAKGCFLAFLDADDTVHTAYYARAVQVLSHYENVFFVGAWIQYFGTKNTIWPTWNPEPPYILMHNTVNSSSLVYKTKAFIAGGLNDAALRYGLEDHESVVNMLHHGFRGVVLPESLYNYRIRNRSMYRLLNRHKLLQAYRYIAQKHAALYQDFAVPVYNLQNANGPSFEYENPSFGITVTSTPVLPGTLFNRAKAIIKRYPAVKRVLLRLRGLVKG